MTTTPTELHAAHVAIEAWLGDDLEIRNNDDRAAAIFDVWKCGDARFGRFHYFWITGDTTYYATTVTELRKHDGVNAANRIWQQRQGQPWQAALEARITAYRRPPRDFSADTAEGYWLCHRVLLPAIEAAVLRCDYMAALECIVTDGHPSTVRSDWLKHRATPAQMVAAFVGMQGMADSERGTDAD